MNRRERILALAALTVVILAGGGLLFKFLFWDTLAAVNAQVADAYQDIDKKTAELKKEQQDQQTIVLRDPRLSHWQRLSLPEDKSQEQEIKSGRSLEEVKKRHEDRVQVDYESFLSELVLRSGFAPNTIKVSSAPADRKGGPVLAGKTPAYTKLSFTVQGQATLDAVVQMLQEFYRTPLLHEVRNLTLTSRQPSRSDQPATPGTPPGPPGAPAFGPPGPPGFGAGAGPARGGDLDVNMTVEALLVSGADKRDALLPESTAVPTQELPDPARRYSDMLAKNMFTGIPATSKLTEDRMQVLAAVKLTSIWNSGGRRWQATYYDQGKGGEEKRVTPRTLDEFTVKDKYDNTLVEAKLVQLDERGLIFLADKKYYRWQCGDLLGTVLDNPLKDAELKDLGLSPSAAGSGN